MGLEAVPAAEETSREKRRKLLGALEKCDNDLKALKKIIMAFRSPEIDHLPSMEIAGNGVNGDKVGRISVRKCRDFSCSDEEKKPCSRLHHLNRINRAAKQRENGGEETKQEPKKKNPAAIIEEDRIISISSINPITRLQERIMKLQQMSSIDHLEAKASSRIIMEINMKKKKKQQEKDEDQPLTWRSKAMGESLEEISKEISWGLKHEMAKIGMALQHHIYGDLIDEMLTDIMHFSSTFSSFHSSSIPPFEACRRRLRF